MEDRFLDGKVIRYDMPWYRERGLVDHDSGHVRSAEFVAVAVAVRVGVVAEPFCGLDAMVVIERVIRELAERDHAAALVKRTNHEAGRVGGTGCRETLRWKPLDSRDVPNSVGTASEDAKADSFCRQGGSASGHERIPSLLKVGRHLSRQHLDIPGAEHAERRSVVSDVVQLDLLPAFVDRSAQRRRVGSVEGGGVEALAGDEDARDEISASPRNAKGRVVATRAAVGIHGGDTVRERPSTTDMTGLARACRRLRSSAGARRLPGKSTGL